MAVIKSNKDTRYGLESIATHDGVKLPCCALSKLSSFREKFGPEAYDQVSQFERLMIILFNIIHKVKGKIVCNRRGQ